MPLKDREKWPAAFNWPGTKSKAKEEEENKVEVEDRFERKMNFEQAVWLSVSLSIEPRAVLILVCHRQQLNVCPQREREARSELVAIIIELTPGEEE